MRIDSFAQTKLLYRPKPKPSQSALIAHIADLCLQYPQYGYRRITKQLQREGMIINHKKVARIMRENGLSCQKRQRNWICTTNSNHQYRIYPNLIKDFNIAAINQLWVADISVLQQRRV